MQYHIQTGPIWESFRQPCDCPVCNLYRISESRLVKQYLGEAVMEPQYRVRVNQRGFCKKHTLDLYNGDNKLGTALQFLTRMEAVDQSIREIKKAKQAAALAKDLAETLDTCVICDTVDEMIVRYCYTIAQMYEKEAEFPALFATSGGFCMPHFVQMLKYVSYAGKSADNYLETLINVQKRSLAKCESELDGFTAKFDYRNAGMGGNRYNDAIPKAIKKLKGDIL